MFSTEIKKRLTLHRLKTLASYATGKVLDIGCAQEMNPYLKDAKGIDILSPKIVLENYSTFNIMDITEELKFDDKVFDTVIAGEVLEHIDNNKVFFKNIHRILKNDGLLIISVPNHYLEIIHKHAYDHMNLLCPSSIEKLGVKHGFIHVITKPLRRFYIEFPSWWILIIFKKGF